jgi:N-acetyl-gamma-glutamyl-phosphate reductase
MKKVGIIGGSGYTGGELIRLVVNHPALLLDFVYSTSRPGTPLYDTHVDLLGRSELSFTDNINSEVDIVFLCVGHGKSVGFLEEHKFSSQTIIIDLSNDFRLKKDAQFQDYDFVYGLPEYQKNKIQGAKAIANPGCFATAIQLALLPLAKEGLIKEAIHINATTGSTGAGVGLSSTGHFSWRNNNVSWYKPFEHQHLREIRETLKDPKIFFLPQRGNFTRGIFASCYTPFEESIKQAENLYRDYYNSHIFTHVSAKEIALKQVVNTNNCVLHLHKYEDQLLVTSTIDNLLKGASGQAIQNLNLIMGWEEDLGLQLKASIY